MTLLDGRSQCTVPACLAAIFVLVFLRRLAQFWLAAHTFCCNHRCWYDRQPLLTKINCKPIILFVGWIVADLAWCLCPPLNVPRTMQSAFWHKNVAWDTQRCIIHCHYNSVTQAHHLLSIKRRVERPCHVFTHIQVSMVVIMSTHRDL